MPDKKILVCDDDADIIDMLEIVLSPHFNTTCEIDSRRVKQLVREMKPDIVILDLWMPFLPGDELIRVLRADKETEDLTIMAISASPDGEKQAMAAGADLFLAKPFEIGQLIGMVRTALQPL